MLSVSSIARVVVNVVRSLGAITAFDTGLILIKDTNYAATRRLNEFTSAGAAQETLVDWGFASSSTAYKAVTSYFGADPAPSRLLISCYPSSETLVEALAAVLDISASFYGIAFGQSETDARVKALVADIEASEYPMMVFCPLIGTASAVVTAGSLLSDLHGLSSKRSVPFYCANVEDAAALMGTAMGLSLSHQSSAFSLCYKEIAGVTPSSLTETEATAIKNLGGNVYLTRGYTHKLLELGTVASGARYDEIMYIDMIASDLQNAAVNLLAENPDKIPQTDDASAMFMNVFNSILINYTDMGVLAAARWRGGAIGPLANGDMVENGYTMWASSYDEQSSEDRAAHKAVPISVALLLAGSVESIVINVNVAL